MISTPGRKTEGIGSAYFADSSAPAWPARSSSRSSRPSARPAPSLAGAILATVGVVAVRLGWSLRRRWGGVLVAGLAVCVLFSGVLPDVRTDDDKADVAGSDCSGAPSSGSTAPTCPTACCSTTTACWGRSSSRGRRRRQPGRRPLQLRRRSSGRLPVLRARRRARAVMIIGAAGAEVWPRCTSRPRTSTPSSSTR